MEPEYNKQTVREIFDRMAKGDSSGLVEAMSDDVCWTLPGNWSWSGSWTPKETVLEALLQPLAAQIRGYRSEADLILAEGDRVVVQARARGTTIRGGAYEQRYCFIFKMSDGQITEVIEHCDSALVERVLELRPVTLKQRSRSTA